MPFHLHVLLLPTERNTTHQDGKMHWILAIRNDYQPIIIFSMYMYRRRRY